ncbi:hypothetical protein BKA70DRAFT_1437425 [Coprinopsis sp. MPI-PUGE-AT-0042]|nr:hypothetical protein BKA70DRAFT_1437425 [Coprinopsis sp. MPI-PUGE-AT-0042]
MKSGIKEAESLLIEEDGNGQEKAKESKKSDLDIMIRMLRKDGELGKNEVIQELLMPVALMPEIDHDVRWCLLKFADLLIKPETEVSPTVKIHIPSIPVLEVAPQIPSVKTSRNMKSGRPPLKIHLPTATAPTELKIPATSHLLLQGYPSPS